MRQEGRGTCAPRTLAVVCVVAMSLGGAVWAQSPLHVGEVESVQIATEHPYSSGTGTEAREWVVHHPGATYIRIHFDRFDLAPGDWVEIYAPAGGSSTVYEGQGPHGNGRFWAFAVPGDTAVIRLEAPTGSGFGFEADRFGRGIVPVFDEGPGVDSVCGAQQWQDVECYRNTYPTEFEVARGSVRILIGGGSLCTAFKISDSGQFMTNNHCTSSQSGVQATQVLMEYQNAGCNLGPAGNSGSVMGSQLLATDYTLDYTMFTTLGDSSGIPCLQLDSRLPPVGERLYIAGHPGGAPKKLSIEDDISGGLCQVNAAPYPGRGANSDVAYYCDTTGGSSGSPVISGDTHAVIALHHFGGCLNSGGRMDLIFPQISSQLDTCSSGTGDCGNGILELGEECDGTELGGATCESEGCQLGGTIACNEDCTLDTSGCGGCPTCDNDGVCEQFEDCDSCPGDCPVGTFAVCGNNVCEAQDGENCITCPEDCNGVQNGKPIDRFCCGGGGDGPVTCNYPLCTGNGNTCSNVASATACCGDLTCEGSETADNCAIDCGGTSPVCGDGTCDPGEDPCSCPVDCGPPAGSEAGPTCDDGADNDCDGATDCADSDCASEPVCTCTLAQVGDPCVDDADCCSNKCNGPSGRKICR